MQRILQAVVPDAIDACQPIAARAQSPGMTGESLEQSLAVLHQAVRTAGDDGAVRAIDVALADVTRFASPRSIGRLLTMLDDGAASDEAMFSLIHAAEAFDCAVYVQQPLDVLPQLRATAPRWASIVLVRSLNKGRTQAELIRALPQADAAVKEAVRGLCERLSERSSTLASQTLAVRAAAR